MGFEAYEFPSVEDLVEDLYRFYGDTVGRVVDNDGHELYNDMAAMEAEANDLR